MILPEHVQHNWCMIFGATEVAVIKFGTACFLFTVAASLFCYHFMHAFTPV
jgi:hypothetical protein